MKRTLTLALVFTFTPFALAQDSFWSVIPGVDFVAWGASVLVFGAAMMLLTEFLKVRARKRWAEVPGTVFTVASFVISIGFSYLMHAQQALTDPTFLDIPPPMNWIAYGLVAGAIASGWYDLSKARKQLT